MAECNLTLPYPCVKPDEKVCKYSYSTWCPTCDRDSPRRRTKSETLEPCRRKGKDMKTFTPKKYDRRQEYENMDMEYEMRDLRLDRIRSNLCELPTSYITNNCQLNTNMSNINITPKLSSNQDFLEFHKFPNDYENSYPLENSVSLLESMARNKLDEKSLKFEQIKPHMNQNGLTKSVHLIDGKTNPKVLVSPVKRPVPVHVTTPLLITNSSQTPPCVNPKPRSVSPRSVLAKYDRILDNNHERNFDTCTFFDKQFDPAEVKERYCKELEILREKLKDLRNHKYSPIRPPTIIKNLDKCIDRVITSEELNDIKIIENVTSPKIDGQKRFSDYKPSPRPRLSSGRISVKTKAKPSSGKLPRNRPKLVKRQISLDVDSDSEKDISEEENCNFTGKKEIEDDCHTIELFSARTHTKKTAREGSGDAPTWPIRESLFPNIPPYIKFNTHDNAPYSLPTGRRHMKWKLSTITPIVVRKTLVNTGFRLVRSELSRESNEWMGTWGKHMKSPVFKTLKNSQKLNHFAGTFQIGRKDRLWKNLQRLMYRYGTKEFGIIPQTFVLPHDLKALKQNWTCKDGSGGEKWIIKPPASARGVGIKVINKWSQLPKQTSLVVQKYISDPYLINGSKFDLRLYVLVTSFNPLRIYIYPEGLVRFASVKYSDNDNDLKDRYMHLTNYSINKLSSQYTANEDANSCQGHKWTLSKLWEYMEHRGINTKTLWSNLKQLVIKTMISGESPISQLCTENVQSRYNCYELFGVDVLLDQRLKPWLLEVNISPSLHSTSPLDLHVKGPLVQTLFNIAQFHFPPRLGKVLNSPPCFEPKIYATTLTESESNKHNYYVQMERREDYLSEILDELTGDDVRVLTQAEDEFVVKGNFERIFPTSDTYKYLQYMTPRYYNHLCDAWEVKFENNRKEGIGRLKTLCAKKLHLKVAPQSTVSKTHIDSQYLNEENLNSKYVDKIKEHHVEYVQDTLKILERQPVFLPQGGYFSLLSNPKNSLNTNQATSKLQPSTEGQVQPHLVETENGSKTEPSSAQSPTGDNQKTL